MSTIDDVFLQRWRAVKSTGIPYVADHGIPTAWRSHPEWGSPLAAEMQLADGSVAQAFTGAIVRWTSAGGVEVVAE